MPKNCPNRQTDKHCKFNIYDILLSLLVVLLGTLQNPLTFVQSAKEKMDDGGKMLTQIKCKPLPSLIILHHCALSSLLSFWQCLTIVQPNQDIPQTKMPHFKAEILSRHLNVDVLANHIQSQHANWEMILECGATIPNLNMKIVCPKKGILTSIKPLIW